MVMDGSQAHEDNAMWAHLHGLNKITEINSQPGASTDGGGWTGARLWWWVATRFQGTRARSSVTVGNNCLWYLYCRRPGRKDSEGSHWGWGMDGSVVKSMYCFWRRSEFSFQHLHQEAPRWPVTLATGNPIHSSGLCTYMYVTCAQTQRHT